MTNPDLTWDDRLEQVRTQLVAPPLPRSAKARARLKDPKWVIGDLLQGVPDHLLSRMASKLEQSEGDFRRYREVAEAWPIEHRVAASWSAHRDLKDVSAPRRYELIRPGMTVRQAMRAAGKRQPDAPATHTLSLDEQADHVITLLTDKRLNDLVLKRLVEQRGQRRMRRAAQMAEDERSAEFKEAMRHLRQAQATKSAETAFLEVVFKLREAAEYVRAVLSAATQTDAPEPLVPQHRQPDLIHALTALANSTAEALDALRDHDQRSRRHDFIDVDVARSRPELLELPQTL